MSQETINCSMTKFKVGDRVAVYTSEYGRMTGVIRPPAGEREGRITVAVDSKSNWPMFVTAMPQQCRRLKKRERRRVWIKAQTQPCEHGAHFSVRDGMISPPPEGPGWIEFVEVRESK